MWMWEAFCRLVKGIVTWKWGQSDSAFNQLLTVSERQAMRIDTLENRTDRQDEEIVSLRFKIDLCEEKHQECDDDRKELAARVERLESQTKGF